MMPLPMPPRWPDAVFADAIAAAYYASVRRQMLIRRRHAIAGYATRLTAAAADFAYAFAAIFDGCAFHIFAAFPLPRRRGPFC